MATLLLLDGHSLAYRAFFALPADLATKSGTVTNAVFGFTSMLAKVVADEAPDRLGVVFDGPGPTFRDELDADYKAGRAETPDLFRAQMPLIREVLDAIEVPVVESEGVEADDVIATLATRAARDGIDVVVVTGDRDAFQLVEDPHLRVLYNKRGVSDYARYDEAGIVERTGVHPRLYPEYAALRGDSSDNLPGVPGIGEKTAAKLLNAYGGLDGIFEHLDELPPKQRENLGTYRDRVLLNHEMTVLRRDVDLDVGPDDLRVGEFDRERVRVLFDQLEFRTLLPRVLEAFGSTDGAEAVAQLAVDVDLAADPAAATAAIDAARTAAGRVALAARWRGAPGRSALAGLAVATTTDRATSLAEPVLGDGGVRDALGALLAPDGPPLVTHRAKELGRGLRRELGIEIGTLDRDTVIMAYLLDPADGRYELEDLVARYLGVEVATPEAGEGTLDLDGDLGGEAAGREAAAVLALGDELHDALAARDLVAVYERCERPLVRVLGEMEDLGIRIDVDFLARLGRELGEQCRSLEARIHDDAGEVFNVNSTPQLRTVLFDKLGLTPVKRTKTGPSTDADSLQKMAAQPDAPEILTALLRYREVEKLRSTYADALPPLVADDGRIHATFNQTATTTGRISSEHPNLQNIPVRTPDGREMRRAFVADEGCVLLAADYSQIELRILAHLSEDSGLVDAFRRDADVHTTTAAGVFGVPEAEVDAAQRRFAKIVNYGLAYGMEAYGLAQRLDIPNERAREILDAYFASFPDVAAYMERTVAEARERGYTTTILGRRRTLPELSSSNHRIRQMGERMAQNAPVQGSAADVFKLAMVDLDRALVAGGFAGRMVLTVHDELVLEAPEAEVDALVPLVRDTMASVCDLRVPLVVDVGVGPTWADTKS